jgi:hypothetical protein
MFSRLNRVFWRWCELVGQCEAATLRDDDLDGCQPPDPGDAYIANGIRQLERFVAHRSRLR